VVALVRAVLLLLMWSSPAMAITPPCLAVPAMLACLNTSEQRSTPGPLPYQMPNTPSYFFFSGYRSSCCVPQTAVAPSSSFTPGWKTMWFSARCFLRPQRLVVAAQRASRGSR
jgi:hypothetical protein